MKQNNVLPFHAFGLYYIVIVEKRTLIGEKGSVSLITNSFLFVSLKAANHLSPAPKYFSTLSLVGNLE